MQSLIKRILLMIFQDNISMRNEKELKHHHFKFELLLNKDLTNPKNEFYSENDLEHQWFTIFKM